MKTFKADLSEIISNVETLRSEIEEILNDEECYFESMPESLQGGSKGETAQGAIDALQDAISAAEEAVQELSSTIVHLENSPSCDQGCEVTAVESVVGVVEDVGEQTALTVVVQTNETDYLAAWDSMRAAIDQAHSILDLKTLRDQSEVLRYAAKVAKASSEIVRKGMEIKLRAERRAGELLHAMPKQRAGQYQTLEDDTVAPSYKQLGIDKVEAHKWQKISSIPEAKFESWLAETPEISTAAALRLASGENNKSPDRDQRVAVYDRKSDKYTILMLVPPWLRRGRGGKFNNNDGYTADSLGKLCIVHDGNSCGVVDLVSQDSCIFLWTSGEMAAESISVMQSWGFEYKTIAFVWLRMKENGAPFAGTGAFSNSNAQYCLLGIRGKGVQVIDTSVSSIIATAGSSMVDLPFDVYQRIDRLFGSEKRIEIFAKRRMAGWDCIGDEVEISDKEEAIP